MVSLYTDEARLKRYEKLLKQREKCEYWFGKSLLFSGVIALAESVGNITAKPMTSMLRGQLEANGISTLIVVLVMAFCVFSIIRRDYRLMLAALTAAVLCLALGFYTLFQIGALQIIPLSISIRYGITWARLKTEEGFPRFQIDIEEHENRTKSQVSYIEQRALDAGVRFEQEALDPNAQMTDLFDSDEKTKLLGAKLHQYHDRSRKGVAEVVPAEKHDGTMDAVQETDIMEEL